MQSRRVEEMISGIEVALHDLCQPLTVLQCKLELEPLEGRRRGDTCCCGGWPARVQTAERGGEDDARAGRETVAGRDTVMRWLQGRV